MSSTRFANAVIDTVVLQYFLLAGQQQLLLQLLGQPLCVPRVVYDPDEEEGTPPPAMSEVMRAIAHHERLAEDLSRPAAARQADKANRANLQTVAALHAHGTLIVADMTDDERRRFGALTNPDRVSEFGLLLPLDPGEAACVAIALERSLIIVTDDNDALRALGRIRHRHPYERIRKLLVRAANDGYLTRKEANNIHATMTKLGFWDHQLPFPET